MSADASSLADHSSIDSDVRRVIRRVLQHAERGETAAVHAIVEQLLADGWRHGAVVSRCLAGVEREIGRRWQEGCWSVTQEHVATAIIDGELALLAATLPPPSLDIEVMVVCAEQEWHVTPARMAALLLRERGFRVRLVSGSVPADELDRTLAASPPDYLAVSCTWPLALAGAARVATVARQRGIPTLAGGAGFGDSPNRALRLGLDGWAASMSEGADRLVGWHEDAAPVTDTIGPVVDLDVLEDRWRVMADEVLERLRATDAVRVAADQPVAPLRQDLTELLQAAHLTALCEDPTLFTDHIDRLGSSPRHQGLPATALEPTIEILRQLVGIYEPADVGTDGGLLDDVLRGYAPPVEDPGAALDRSVMIARTFIEVEDPELLRRRLVGLATELVDGCDQVGLIVVDRGARATAVPSNSLGHRVEELERELGEGPCTEAIERRDVVESTDLTTEDRWPDYGRSVLEQTSIRSVLAIPLTIRGRIIGALGLFAESADAFDDHDRSVAVSFAIQAAAALHAAIQQRTLTEAIGTRDLIGQAKGILMEREGIDGDGAFALLRTVSNDTNTKLRDVAAFIVHQEKA